MVTVRRTKSSQFRSLVFVVLSIGAFVAVPARAQSIVDSARIRITPLIKGRTAHTGQFLRASVDSIWFVPNGSQVVHGFPINDIAKIEQSSHYKRRLWRAAAGASMALAAGAAGAAIFLNASRRHCQCQPDGMRILAFGELIAVPVGAAVGASRGGEQWRSASLNFTTGAATQVAPRARMTVVKF